MDQLEPQAEDVARLLTAIDRVRSERDGLRRDMEFVTVENKFKVEALEAELARAREHKCPTTPTPGKDQDDLHSKAQRGAFVSILVSQHLVSQCDTYRSQVHKLSVDLEESRRNAMDVDSMDEGVLSRVKELEGDNAELRDTLASIQGQHAAAESEVLELRKLVEGASAKGSAAEEQVARLQAEAADIREALLSSREQLQGMESQVSDLTGRISSLENDLSRERASHQATGSALAQAEQQITELSESIDNTISERDSLSLRITHLEQDLHDARQEFEQAESRISELQTQQLSSMSSSEVTRALRKQIEDMEYRVNHRTEQLGIHQHDIKRLETNLRLQEERITEMTSDMEVLQGEKDAMIEDCNTTREERDEALRKCEELEERVEMLEDDDTRAEADRDVEMQVMVEAVFQEKAARRRVAKDLVSLWSTHSLLQARVREAEQFKAHASQEAVHLELERSRAIHDAMGKAARVQILQDERDAALVQVRETSSTLETLRAELAAATSSHDPDPAMQADLALLQTQLATKATEFSELQTRHQSLCSQYDDAKSTFASQVSDLESRIRVMEDANAEVVSRRDYVENEVARVTEELRAYRSSGAEDKLIQERLRSELEEIRASQLEETGGLREEIAQARVDLEEARQHYDNLEATHKLALDDLTQAKDHLEAKLAEVTEKFHSSDGAQVELEKVQERYSSEIKDFQERLDRVSHQLEAAQRELEEQNAASDEKIRSLEDQVSEASNVLHAKEDLEMELEQLRARHEAEIKSLERRITDLANEEHTVRQSQSDLESRCQELSQTKSDLEDQVARMTTTVDQLQQQLKALSGQHNLASERHSAELKTIVEQGEEVQRVRDDLAEQLSELQSKFEEAQSLMGSLQEEKQYVQADITQLEAEVQRLLSLQRYQESQLKDSEHQIVGLRDELENARAEHAEAEKVAKAVEIDLQLQSVQHEKALSTLRREVSSLRVNSNLEETIAELSERNNEMEQLLQAKCMEIEENDDRVIELLKEKKKLTAKVDSLTKKITALQAKMSASSTPTNGTPLQSQRPTTITPPAIPLMAPVASSSHAPPTFHTPSTPNSRRLASGSSLSRPKTPEARVPPPPVFKARTPESKRASARPQPQRQQPPPPPPQIITTSASSSLNKKRRAPDDFEDCESLLPQGFTVDSLPSPDMENMQSTTPRVRRALQAVRSGFTPVRAHSAQQPTPTVLTSPARRATTGASLIADVTNSPRGASMGAEAKASKRGWLGKIRGGPANAPRSVSSRPAVFDRQTGGEPSR
ncbi:hypothetical protein EUX98_g2243 [Antrodiella citrinella]|uniref:Uncharacterized protein n=1 Tax=Antrodiella citrinella TaxID=2447956 RepID=A0A4S4MZH4_9APHY|nr:hypothetical protein EUX98_g2243 [Antrodiella citrinella]